MELSDLTKHLLSFVTDHKAELFLDTIENRTRHLTVAIENVFQPHNASAVLRSADCFGIQDVHIIENDNEYQINPDVALGASKWLNLHRYNEKENNTLDCINSLKEKGYRIVATTPHTNDCTLDELDVSKPTALLFGTEKDGLSELALNASDDFVRIPMYGFTESFNISVSAALCMYELSKRIRKENISWQLTNEEKDHILRDWCRKVVKHSELLEQRFESDRS